MWLFFSLLGYGVLAVISILDKFIVSKTTVKPALFTFYSTVFLLPLFLLLPFNIVIPNSAWLYFLILISGFSFAFGLWTMYLAFEESEVSHTGPLIGGVTPLFVLLLAGIFLQEVLSWPELLAVGFLVVGSVVISLQKIHGRNSFGKGIGLAVISCFCFALSHVAAKYLYDQMGFWNGLIWSRGAIGLFGALMLFLPSVRRGLRPRFNWHKFLPWPRAEHNNFFLVTMKNIGGMGGVFLIQLAIAVGSVTLVNALAGVQYGLLVILVAILSAFFPKYFKEHYAKGEMVQELAAVLLIGIGLLFLL